MNETRILCDACKAERIGCACDGALGDGCFRCTPDKYKRPTCTPDCANYVPNSEHRVLMSRRALASADAIITHGRRGRTDDEQQFDAILETCVFLSHEHAQMPAPKEVAVQGGRRLYAVTTIAASARFGGIRTVTVCDSFDRAKQIVETNEGDIYECSYKLALIDTIVAGWLYYHFDEQYWYRWVGDPDEGSYKAIERPKAYDNVTGIGGIG